MTEKFWLDDPYILLNNDKIFNLFPSSSKNLNTNLNAITRLILLISIISYALTRGNEVLLYFISAVITIVLFHKYKTTKKSNKKKNLREAFNNQDKYKESIKKIKKDFTTPDKKNPMMNVMITDINKKPVRNSALPSFAPSVEKDINEKVKENLDPRLFKDLGDNMVFEQSMRNFYTTANTDVVNDQKAFAEFCYGSKGSCKDGDVTECVKHNERYIQR
tara:strand:- start:3851 stop:4507 length:657 start_codon:yes stop_codon:yes gene_type:complete